MKRGSYRYARRNAQQNWLVLTVGTILAAVIVLGGIWSIKHRQSALPSDIKKQVSFVAYIPSSPWQTISESYKYSTQSGVLSFVTKQYNVSLTFTEQAAPSQFSDIPQYYPALLNKLNQYDSVGTANGTVNLIRPSELQGRQEAIVYQNGTLIFVNPSKDLSKDDWRKLFNNMTVVK